MRSGDITLSENAPLKVLAMHRDESGKLLDDSVAMSARMYDRPTGGIGLFVGEGRAAFADVSIATRQ